MGVQKVMRDPSIVKGPDGTFHLVWTSSWKGDKGFSLRLVERRIHWSKPRLIRAMMTDPTTVNVWAPELFYDDVKAIYGCVGIVRARQVPDTRKTTTTITRLYYVTTKDFKKFSKAKVPSTPTFSCIDATLLKRGKDDYVMVLKDNSRDQRNIKVAFAKSPYGPWSKASEPFTESFCEDPTTAFVKGWYYIYYDSYRHGIYGAARTRDFVRFRDQTGAVSFPVGHKHGTVFMARRGDCEEPDKGEPRRRALHRNNSGNAGTP